MKLRYSTGQSRYEEVKEPSAPPNTPQNERMGIAPLRPVLPKEQNAQSCFIASFKDATCSQMGSFPPKTGHCFIDPWALRQCLLDGSSRDQQYSVLYSGLVYATRFSSLVFVGYNDKIRRFAKIEPVILVKPTISSSLTVFVHNYIAMPDSVHIIRRNTEYFSDPVRPLNTKGSLFLYEMPKSYSTGVPEKPHMAECHSCTRADIHVIQLPLRNQVVEVWVVDKGLPFDSPFECVSSVEEDFDVEVKVRCVVDFLHKTGDDKVEIEKWC